MLIKMALVYLTTLARQCSILARGILPWGNHDTLQPTERTWDRIEVPGMSVFKPSREVSMSSEEFSPLGSSVMVNFYCHEGYRDTCEPLIAQIESFLPDSLEKIAQSLYPLQGLQTDCTFSGSNKGHIDRRTEMKECSSTENSYVLPDIDTITFSFEPFTRRTHVDAKVVSTQSRHKVVHINIPKWKWTMETFSPPSFVQKVFEQVITHELVHVYQHRLPKWYNPSTQNLRAKESAPYSLIEGIADWVVINGGHTLEGIAPPRPLWARDRAERWDIGYARTAYFLEWIEDVRIGKGAIQ